jgi:hypothetical protein
MPDLPPYPGAPRWVKVSAIAAAAVTLLVVILIHAGGEPRHNMSSAGGHVAPESGH